MRVPERIGTHGNVVPSYQIDNEMSDELLKYVWSFDASNKGTNGYMTCKIAGKKVYLHRHVFYLKHGYLPAKAEGTVDHINGDKLDNRSSNLRCVCQRVQSLNRPAAGVRWLKNRQGKKRWEARIAKTHIGYFYSKEEAVQAYESKKKETINELTP